ncbi:MAG: hypothetical protein JJE05_01770 [Actinobacteria bacterium]|nr:hypothetical protein [Actinomycetota bacterium]
MSRYLEHQAMVLNESPVVLSTFQDVRHFSRATERLYERLAGELPLVGAFGVDLPAEPGSGVRGTSLDSSDPLNGEWVVIVIGSHFAAGFAARDLGDAGPDMERRFDYAVTYDRNAAVRMASSLLSRIKAA